jgi:hypothetical protein
LYDLQNDPGELTNLYGHRDEVSCALQLELEQWFCTYADPRMSGVNQPVKGRGQIRKVGPGSGGHPSFSDYSLNHGRR